MADVDIRVATEADLDGLTESSNALIGEDALARDPLWNADYPRLHGRAWCSGHVGDPDSLVLVAVRDGAVVGHLIGSFAGPSRAVTGARTELVSMRVAPELRGARIGTRLVQAFVGWSRERGAVRMSVSAFADNEGALRFYARCGFTPMDVTLTAGL